MGHSTTARRVTPITRTTLTESTFDQLISYVVKGEWKAGDRIPPERELCQQLGIARTSLREALKAMELVGMLDSRVGDGTFVCPRSEFLSRPLAVGFHRHGPRRTARHHGSADVAGAGFGGSGGRTRDQ